LEVYFVLLGDLAALGNPHVFFWNDDGSIYKIDWKDIGSFDGNSVTYRSENDSTTRTGIVGFGSDASACMACRGYQGNYSSVVTSTKSGPEGNFSSASSSVTSSVSPK
jgi:hypothetical protein